MKAESSDGIAQVVYYQAGVGSMGGITSRITGGIYAEGLAENIRAAYNFVCSNYHQGDELYFLGFSRGAFTARSIAGMIGSVGVLTKTGLPYLSEIVQDFENRWDSDYRPRYPNIPFPNKPSARNPIYQEQLDKRRLSRIGVPIKAIAVWDTVGSLGIPRIGWLEKLGIQGVQSKETKEYLFYDTSLSNCVENAFQALALDELRSSFSPTVWEKNRGNNTVWFPGVHSNVGGGYEDQQLANITLAWMIAQLEPFIDFKDDYILEQFQQNRQYYIGTGQRPRPWSFGEIYRSLTGFYILGGSTRRTPGMYYRVDPYTGRETSTPLRETNEYVHASVRSRVVLGGPGVLDDAQWEAKALQDYKLRIDNDPEKQIPTAVWESRFKVKGSGRRILPESPLWETERKLLSTSPQVQDYLLGGGGVGGRRKRPKR
ncbi:hypothetical protein MMC09_003489 [Bachmanniomyces sp. S44760]|nr:hypothetical protein [Bachmanniomyces sp. S44760]